MRKRIGIFGATDEALQLVPLLEENPEVEIAAIVDSDVDGVRARLGRLEPELIPLLDRVLTDDANVLANDAGLHAVIDAATDFVQLFPNALESGAQIVSPLTARLLWCYGATSGDHKGDLLQALRDVVESYSLTIDADELFGRMLEIARSVTGADGGSVMLMDAERRELTVRVAVGVEPELWPKIRVKVGEGIAGRVAAEARPLRLRGKADRQNFRIVRERLDVESALCVPLVHDGSVLGVLNLHHSTRSDAFGDDDLAFIEQLAELDTQIIARAQEHEALRNQAARYEAVRNARSVLGTTAVFGQRLNAFCHFVADHAGGGIVTLYLHDSEDGDLRLAATSLEGGGFGGEYRVALGTGIDGQAAETGTPAFLRRPDGSLAYAAIPLVAGELLIGVLSVQTGSDAPSGRAAEEILLEISAAASEEIAQAERESRMVAATTKMSAINETGIRMVSATDPADVLRLGTSGAAMVLEADHAILRLQDEHTGRYVIRSYFGSADGRIQERLFRLDKRASVDTIKRRTPVLVRHLEDVDELREFGRDFRSLIAAPLKREGRVIGTLAIYDKVSADRFVTGSFGDDDLQLFGKFVSYLERAVANALFYASVRQLRNFDPETGLPNGSYLAKRVDEEIARNTDREGALALAVCRIENLGEIEAESGASRARRVIEATIESLRQHLRDFDVIGRSAPDEFTMLLPDPGFNPGERVFTLARAVADDVTKDDDLNDPVRVALSFGYAVYPAEGTERDGLTERAREPRIRMV